MITEGQAMDVAQAAESAEAPERARAKARANRVRVDMQSPAGKGKVSGMPAGKQNLLMRALWNRIALNNETPHALAQVLDVTYAHLLGLSRGERPVANVSKDFLVRAADYLEIPVAQAYVWAGVLAPEDFYEGRSLALCLENMYADMSRDSGYNIYMPTRPEWESMPTRAKLTIALLYEKVRGVRFLDHLNLQSAV